MVRWGRFFGREEKLRFGLLEAPVADHCNLRCRGCSHHSPFLKPHYYDLERFVKDVNALSQVAEFGELRLIGGEPLLNREIAEYLTAARSAGIARVYGVITNGVLLHQMGERFFQAVDYIRVSGYPATSAKRGQLRELLAERARQFHFRWVIQEIENFYDIETSELSQDDAQKSFDGCRRRVDFPMIHSGYFYKCMRPPTTREYLENRKTCANVPDFATVDGVSLDLPRLLQQLKGYMSDQNALQSCRFCRLGFFDAAQSTRYSRLKKKLGKIKGLRAAIHASPVTSATFRALNSRVSSTSSETRISMLKHSMITRADCQPRELVDIRRSGKR